MPLTSREHSGETAARGDGRASPESGRRGVLARFITPRDGENIDAVGVPIRFHYRLLAIFAIGVAAAPLGFSLEPGGEEMRNPLTQTLCIGGLLYAPLILTVGKRNGYVFRNWIFQSALFFALMGTFLSNLVTPNLIAPFMTNFILVPIGAAFYLSERLMLVFAVGSSAAILYVSSMVDEPNAMLRGMILAIVAVCGAELASELKAHLTHAVENNREISERDPLTGVHNLHRFEQRLADEIARAGREGGGFDLVMFDLDNFKQVNDSYNHSTGDEVLIAAAEAINSALLPSDLLVRRGGDEFAAIIPAAPGRDTQMVVDMARRRIERARTEICPGFTPYASAGWVTYEPPETAESLLERADGALHEAKKSAPERRGHLSQELTAVAASADGEQAGVVDLRVLHNESDVLRDDPIRGLIAVCWRAAIRVIVSTCLVVTAMTLAGRTSFELSPAGIFVLAGWTIVFVPLAIWATTRKKRPPYVKHMLFIAAFTLIAAGCAVVGDAAPTMIDLFIFTLLLIVALLPYKRAVFYLVLGVVLYGFFLYASDFPFSEIRLTVATVNLLLASVILAVTRYHTILAAREKAKLARTDALTALPNTRRLRDRLDDEIRRCEVTGDGLALLMLDLDDFKPVNDLYSHSLGDKVLVAVADAIRSVCRHADMPARRGGDEFAVVMTDSDENEAMIAGERVAEAIQVARMRMVTNVNPNASVGWAVWRAGESADELIARADAALHDKKSDSYRERLSYAAVS